MFSDERRKSATPIKSEGHLDSPGARSANLGAEKFEPRALAVHMRGLFAKRKKLLLRAVAAERQTPANAMRELERYYERMTHDYLRTPDTTYGVWLEHGPRAELEEVREARRDDAVWDRLVDRMVAK